MIRKWLFGVFARKAIISISKAVVSYLSAGVIADLLVKNGVQIDPNRLQEGMTVGLLGALKFAEDKYELNKANKEAKVG